MLTAPSTATAGNQFGRVEIKLTNTGASASTDPSLHPTDATALLNSDIYRVSASVNGVSWTAEIPNALATVKFGESVTIPVTLAQGTGAASSATLNVKAVSESDPSKTATATVRLSNR